MRTSMAYGSLPSRWNRSVSNPARRPSLEIIDPLPLDRRQSLDSVIPFRPGPNDSTKQKHHGLGSFKALREKFQAIANRGKGSLGQNSATIHGRNEGSVRSADSPKKLVKRAASGRKSTGGRGSNIVEREKTREKKSEMNGGNFSKSASMPAINSLGDTNDRIPLNTIQPSVDSLLARTNSKDHLPPPLPVSSLQSPRPPRTSSSNPAPSRRPQTSENLSPTSQPLPVFNRISTDFARPALAPPLSTLRAPQIRETETLNMTFPPLSDRYSRTLPGATLPKISSNSNSIQQQQSPNSISRSQSIRDSSSSSVLQFPRRSSSMSQESTLPSSIDSSSRAQKRHNDRLKDDLAYRRHSLSPVISSSNNPSPEDSPTRIQGPSSEAQRGKTLSEGAARRSSTGLGFGSTLVTSPNEVAGGGGGGATVKRRPSKPFPSNFEEVPFQPLQATSPTPTEGSPALSNPRRTLKAISIAPRKNNSTSPALSRVPLSPVQKSPSSVQLSLDSTPALATVLRRDGSDESGGGGAASNGHVGSYAARLAELRLLRTPTFDGAEKRSSTFETVEPDTEHSRPEPTAETGRPTGEEEEAEEGEESRPVSPTHSTNSPGADHPFRLSTYLDILPLTQSSLRENAIPSPTSPTSSPPKHPSSSGKNGEGPEQKLTLAQMEEEIVKMERELTLAGTPRSFFTEEGGDANEGDFDSGPSAPGSPVLSDNAITPRTARKWSIVEVENAYERMKRLLGSTSSSRVYSPSETGGGGDGYVGNAGDATFDSSISKDEEEKEELTDDVFSTVRTDNVPDSSLPSRPTSPSAATKLELKPLPGLPPPSPSKSDRFDTTDSQSEPLKSPSSHRQLLLPARVRSKSSTDDFSVRQEEGIDSSTTRTKRPHSTEPVSPSRSSGRRSRLGDTGLFRSGVGREIQRRALGGGGGDLSLDSPSSPNSRAPRQSVHRLIPPVDSPRRREQTRTSESSSWYPSTPRRNTFGRTRSATTGSLASDQDKAPLTTDYDSESTTTSTARPELEEVRSLDKLQIFFKYTAVKAELSKTEIERDALFEALQETRETLAKVRSERDTYESELKQEKLFSAEIKQHLGEENEVYIDRLENLIASRAAWQLRAEEAFEELRKSKLEITRLEQERKASRVSSPSTIVPATSTSPPGSPTLTMNQDNPLAPPSTSLRPPSSPIPSTFRQKRTVSMHSNASSAMGFEALGKLDVGSPLISQTMAFPKSSIGSLSSPTKSTFPFASLPSRIPFPSSRKTAAATSTNGPSSTGLASERDDENQEDRSFDSTSSYPCTESEVDLKGLRERDDAFLNELTNEIPKETLEEQHRNLSHLLS
ncbi:uncharacterized protein JCM6883_003898 [Sporobolomyces salmoneus]|uniref:uncharacterized protein n=1 Tax=Sporobolomyces salmoneus TaxID=183962 RepID=UPI0031748DBE